MRVCSRFMMAVSELRCQKHAIDVFGSDVFPSGGSSEVPSVALACRRFLGCSRDVCPHFCCGSAMT